MQVTKRERGARLLLLLAALFLVGAAYLAVRDAYAAALANCLTAALGVLTASIVRSGKRGPSMLVACGFAAALLAANLVVWLTL